jgi:hypothetical protein
MYHPTKIATCSYCGTRAALILKGKIQHELACSACGAPLHDIKMMPLRADTPSTGRTENGNRPKPMKRKSEKPKCDRKKPRRKNRFRSFLDEAFDVVEDIFD